ncbi:MAG: hypothetical protein AAGI06_05900 [Pseudomonadota bacterium]
MTKDASWAEHSAVLGDAETNSVSGGAAAGSGHLNAIQARLMAGAAASRERNFPKAKAHFDKCRQALLAATDDPAQHFAMARHYAEIDDFSVALELLEPLAKRSPENMEILRLLGTTAQRSGKLDLAVTTYKKLVALDPENVELHKEHTRTLLARRKYTDALAASEAWLKVTPGDTEALSLKIIATNEVKGRAAAAELLDFERFASFGKLEPPEGYGSAATFNMSLETAVYAETTVSVRQPRGDFRVTEELFGAETGPLYELENLICEHVDAYYDGLDKRRKTPFMRTIPDQYILDGWGRIYEGPSDQEPEIHKDAHLCGYYYVKVPDGGEANSSAAALTLGPSPGSIGGRRKLPSLNVWPEQASIALFPAYVYAQTKPVITGQRMICIAFSVIPA